MGVGGQYQAPAVFSWERPCAHCTRDWVGPRASLDGCGKSHPPLGFCFWTVQSIVNYYTDYAILAH